MNFLSHREPDHDDAALFFAARRSELFYAKTTMRAGEKSRNK